MTTAMHHTVTGPPVGSRRRIVAELAIGLVPLLLIAGVTRWTFDLPGGYVRLTVVTYVALATLLIRRLPPQAWPGLGPANRVTVGRAMLVLSLAALVAEDQVLVDAGYWWIIGMATIALCLDGVDGLLARRTGTATAFGARFDMELDSFLMLVLAALVWRSGRVGPWVLLLGLPRYLFVASGALFWPWLRAPLPDRIRRKAGCVAQGIALVVCLGPIVPPALAAVGAAVTLVVLVGSFAADIVWLFRHKAFVVSSGSR